MTWSYSGNPLSSSVDAVRFYLQDVDEDNAMMSDEEILFLLSTDLDPKLAAIAGIKTLILRYSTLADTVIGETSISYTQKVSDLSQLLKDMSSEATLGTEIGIATSSDGYQGPKMLFKKGMFDNG